MNAVVETLWIGEVKPDTFSFLIQKKQSWVAGRPINYSHSAMRFNGVIWHCSSNGVIDEPEAIALEGSIIRLSKKIELSCPPDILQAYLEGERGKGYGTWQNWGIVFPWIRPFVMNKASLRNCSEFIGCTVSKYLPDGHEMKLSKYDLDWSMPYDLEALWKPEVVS